VPEQRGKSFQVTLLAAANQLRQGGIMVHTFPNSAL